MVSRLIHFRWSGEGPKYSKIPCIDLLPNLRSRQEERTHHEVAINWKALRRRHHGNDNDRVIGWEDRTEDNKAAGVLLKKHIRMSFCILNSVPARKSESDEGSREEVRHLYMSQ